jgi:dipeptidyl aminopeptidase/acylaminoacyl peptidase
VGATLTAIFKPFVPAIALAMWTMACSADVPRAFTVRDSIQMSDFVEGLSWSSDGKGFAAITQRGLLPEGATEATLWVFDSAVVTEAIRSSELGAGALGSPVVRMTATINGDGGAGFGKVLMHLSWEPGGESLLFLGRNGRENRQIFRVTVSDHSMTALTPPTQDVVDYAERAGHIVYLAGPDVIEQRFWTSTDALSADVTSGTGQAFEDLLYPNVRSDFRYMPTQFEVWQIRKGATPESALDGKTHQAQRVWGSYYPGPFALSPDGSRAVITAHVEEIPSSWQRYAVDKDSDGLPFHPDPSPSSAGRVAPNPAGDYSRALQYVLVDLASGTHRPLLQAPASDFQRGGVDDLRASWSQDGRFVAVTSTYLPLAATPGAPEVTTPCSVAIISVEKGRLDCVVLRAKASEPAVTSISWDNTADRLTAQAGASRLAFERRGTTWVRVTPRVDAPPVLEVSVRQALNDPPVLVAKDSVTGREASILDPNPQLSGISLGHVDVYTWKDRDGRVIRGGLAKPPDYQAGRRYPLVIQTHGFSPHRFFNTGLGSNTSVAGRALAGREMLILQVQEPHYASDGTWREASERGTQVYLAAIDQLAAEGLVDASKVGITGYSRTGVFVLKALVDAPRRFAAAVVANAAPASLYDYYTFVDEGWPEKAADYAKFVAGALPLGPGLQQWTEHAPGLQTNLIDAPVLVSAGDPWHLIALWSLYAPLRAQGKPVYLQYIRSGSHNLVKPLQVLAHEEMLVDWFDFWLNGHEASDPQKAVEYADWRELRAKNLETGPHN